MSKRSIRPGMTPLWMLNDASTVAQKIAYMRRCRAGGIASLCLHPRDGNLIPYASGEWFAMVRALVEEGHRLGMRLWLYDEDPYPSGAAGGLVMAQRPDLLARAFRCQEAPAHLKPGQLWPIGRRLVVWAGIVPGRRAGAARGAIRDLTAEVGPLRTDWFMTRWDSRHYYADTPLFDCPRGRTVNQRFSLRLPDVPPGHRVIAITLDPVGGDNPWGGLPDLLNPESFDLFRRITLDAYERVVGRHFGRTVPGIFTDEAKPSAGYTPGMYEDFRKRFGYDLRPRLYQLFGEALNETYERTRVDYRRWLLDRFLAAFVRPYRKWCEEHGLLLVGHFSTEDDPVDEPWTVISAMPVMKAASCPGTDVIVPSTGHRRAPVLNIGSLRAASLRAQTGAPYAVSETLALAPWGVTTQKCRQLLGWQKVLGIDRFFPHGFAASSEGIQNYEAPPDYGPNSSIFRGMGALNDWLRRVEPLLDGAEDCTETAVLNSVISYWALGFEDDARRFVKRRNAMWQTVLSALQSHVGFHFVDEPDLAQARFGKGKLIVGRCAYRTLLVPPADFITREGFDQLVRAAGAGVRVFWFGGGPRRLVSERGGFRRCPRLPGRILQAPQATVSWCRRELSALLEVRGRDGADLYVRRACARGKEYVLAANVEDQPLTMELAVPGRELRPQEGLVDGRVTAVARGLKWLVPAQGFGLFEVGYRPVAAAPAPVRIRSLNLQTRTFTRMGSNILRLNTPVARVGGRCAGRLDHPKPYWELSPDYVATGLYHAFSGPLPVESKVAHRDLRYRFEFNLRNRAPALRLILDPRCARGRLRVFVNSRLLGGWRQFPLEHTRPLRLPLQDLRKGRNSIELRFDVDNAMEGLLSQLYIEGNFDVELGGRRPELLPPAAQPMPRSEAPLRKAILSKKGWQADGMPHYMGSGMYRWEEPFSAADLNLAWTLELEKVVDSAALRVNGRKIGSRAWEPWQWKLTGLHPGRNRFELTVSGTAGNKHTLDWPNQPQGWIGAGRFLGARVR